MRLRILSSAFFFPVACLLAAEPSAPSLPWTPVSIDAKDTPVDKLLHRLKEQTGLAVLDDIGEPRSVSRLKLERVSFWQAGDAIARGSRARLSPSPKDGSLRLLPLLPGEREAPASYDGNFRVRLVRLSSTTDLDSDRSQCVATLELVWLPHVRPLFVEGKLRQVKIRDARNDPVDLLEESSGLTAVDGRSSYTTDLAMPGFPRADAAIRSLEGVLGVVAPSKFIEYRFEGDLATLRDALPGGALRQMKQDGVTCRLDRVLLARDRWTLQVGLEYPPGTKSLESFQAWSLVVQNEMKLVSADGKRTLTPSSYVVESVSSRRAQVSYHFTDRRGEPKDWRVRYSAPERLIEVPVRFAFRSVPLP